MHAAVGESGYQQPCASQYSFCGCLIRRIDLAGGAVSVWSGQPGKVGVKGGPLPARLSTLFSLASTPGGDLLAVSESALLTIR